MGIDNLAKVFGPTLVGYSSSNPEPTQMIKETQTATQVITAAQYKTRKAIHFSYISSYTLQFTK